MSFRFAALAAASLALLISCADTARAEIVVFDLGLNGNASVNGLDLEGFSNASTSVNGSDFTVTMNASVENPGVFNLVNRGLGINSIGRDRGGQIDSRNVADESMTIQLSTSRPADIRIVSLDFQGIGGNGNSGDDSVGFRMSGFSTVIDGSNVNAFDQITINQSYLPGTNIQIAYLEGNGFRLQSIVLDVVPTPEPSSLLMFGLVVGMIGRVRNRLGSNVSIQFERRRC